MMEGMEKNKREKIQLLKDGGNGKKKIKGKEIGCSRMEGMEKNKGKN
jgi:hypothetical protein